MTTAISDAASRYPLTKAPVRKRVPHVTDLMFRDTIAARMLRRLCEVGEMPQADFSKEYHVRCARPAARCRRCDGSGCMHEYQRRVTPLVVPVASEWQLVRLEGERCVHCDGKGTYTTGRSSMVNNFGRFIHQIAWGARGTNIWARNVSDHRKPYACIGQIPLTTKQGKASHRASAFRWTRGSADDLAATLTNEALHAAFTSMERQMLMPRKTDVEAETVRWIVRLQTEINRRAK